MDIIQGSRDSHIGRGWSAPDPFCPGCGCALLSCGLVSFIEANTRECRQHSAMAGETIRSSHPAERCPGE